MAFFYKYVDLTPISEESKKETDDEATPDESSALILEKSTVDGGSEKTGGGYVTGSDLDLDYETTSKSLVSSDEF